MLKFNVQHLSYIQITPTQRSHTMATRRRIGVSAATTEAARRQLMQPVPCWEKVWVVPENATVTSNFKVYKWAKTEKTQVCSSFPAIETLLNNSSSNSVMMRVKAMNLWRPFLMNQKL